MYFQYGEAETAYLSAKDERMAALIAQVGHIEREVDTDLFSAVVHHIVGQQISTKAQATIWKRMRDEFGVVDAAAILGAGVEKLQSFGMTFRKAEYITDFARKIESGEFDLEGIWQKPDDEAIRELSSLKGVGVWTAEMILLFCMQRPDVFSYDDLAIQRGLRMVYHHRKIDGNCSKSTAAGSVPIAAWPASTSGRQQAARCRASRTTRRPKSRKGRDESS